VVKIGALAILIALVAAACGGDDAGDGVASIDDVVASGAADSETTQPPSEDSDSDEDAVLQFAACMRDRNIDFPDPTVDAEGNVGFDFAALEGLVDMDQEELESAFESCVSLLAGVSFGFERIFETEFQDDVVVFAGCMRENGIDMPDPDFSGITEGRQLFPGWEPELGDPDFEAAFEACEELLPGIPGIAGGSP
jgi:hypothetical protein